MQKWEYLYLDAEVDDDGAVVRDLAHNQILPYVHRKPQAYQEFLNKLGSEGWELATCLPGKYQRSQNIYFKRPIE